MYSFKIWHCNDVLWYKSWRPNPFFQKAALSTINATRPRQVALCSYFWLQTWSFGFSKKDMVSSSNFWTGALPQHVNAGHWHTHAQWLDLIWACLSSVFFPVPFSYRHIGHHRSSLQTISNWSKAATGSRCSVRSMILIGHLILPESGCHVVSGMSTRNTTLS